MKRKVCIALIGSGVVIAATIAALIVAYKQVADFFDGTLDIGYDCDLDI